MIAMIDREHKGEKRIAERLEVIPATLLAYRVMGPNCARRTFQTRMGNENSKSKASTRIVFVS